MAPGGRRMVVLQGRTAPQTDAAVSGRQYQIAPLSSPRSAFTGLNRTAIRRHGATSISISWGMAVGPAIGRLAVDRSDEVITSSLALRSVDTTPSTTRMFDPTLLGPERQGLPAPQERRMAKPSRCHQQPLHSGKPKHGSLPLAPHSGALRSVIPPGALPDSARD